jgi:hypothetical protein
MPMMRRPKNRNREEVITLNGGAQTLKNALITSSTLAAAAAAFSMTAAISPYINLEN